MRSRSLGIVVGVCAGLLASGCAGGESLVDRMAGAGRVTGDAEHVVVHGMASAADALPFAIAHCSHVKKSAQYERHEDANYAYRCVTR